MTTREILESIERSLSRIEKRLAALEKEPLPKAKTNRKFDRKAFRAQLDRKLLNR